MRTGKKNSARFKIVNLPPLAKYYQFKREESRILAEIKATCLAPKEGVLVFRGAIGVGKTGLLSHIFTDSDNQFFLLRECKIDTVIWLNCQQYNGRDQVAFTKRLLRLGNLTCPDDPLAVFYNVDQMMRYIAVKRHRVLVALDDVADLALLEALRRDCPDICCCAILHETLAATREKPTPGLIRKTIVIEPIPDEAMYELLSFTYDLKNKLKDDKIKDLMRHCFGHHLLATHLSYKLNDSGDCQAKLRELLAVIQATMNPTPLILIRHLYETSLFRMDPILHKNYHAFLLFQPDEPVSLDDLIILWGFCGDSEAKERALQFCSYFEKKCLIRRVQLSGDPNSSAPSVTGIQHFYTLHPFLHEIAVAQTKSHYRYLKEIQPYCNEPAAKYLTKLRLLIVKGSACTDGANVKSSVDIACQCITQKRRHLLEKIVNVLQPSDLEQLLRQRSTISQQKTLLHFLYEATWPDDVAYEDVISKPRGINHSYRLMVKIIEKLKQAGIEIGPIFYESDEIEGGSLLQTIFWDMAEIPQQKFERMRVFKSVVRYRHDCEEQIWYDTVLARKDLLITAIIRNDLQFFRELLAKKASNGSSFKGDRVAFAAARLDKLDALKVIIETFGVDTVMAMCDEDDGNTVYSLAARNGHIGILNYLVLLRSDFITWRNPKSGKTLLMTAASNGHLKTTRFLSEWDVENTAAEMEPQFGSYTALALAAGNGHLEIVRYLADVAPKSVNFGNGEKSALSLAAENGHTDVVTFLADRFPALIRPSALSAALTNNEIESAKILICRQPYLVLSPNEATGQRSPLMTAAADCDLDGVMYIYEMNKEAITWQDSSGWTPLMAAVNHVKLDVVAFLYDKYPDAVNIRDESGYTPLALASQTGYLPLVQFLYEKYREAVEITDNNGETAFMRAVLSDAGDLSVVRFLFEKHGNAVAMRDIYGVTPLMNAAFKHHLDICRFICEVFPAGNDWRDSNGKSALAYAKSAASLDETRRGDAIAYLSSKIKEDDQNSVADDDVLTDGQGE